MKITSLYRTLAFALVIGLTSCTDDETAGLSRSTVFADIEIEGGDFQTVKVGDTYVEEGAIATEAGEPVEVTIDGTVDTSAPGIYPISYLATNKDGYVNEVFKTVAVVPAVVPDEVKNTDLSGSYLRSGNPVTVEKITDGLYYIDNFGGVASPSAVLVGAYFFHIQGDELLFPDQPSSIGTLAVNFEEITPTGFQWAVDHPSFLDNIRSFIKVTQPPIRYEN